MANILFSLANAGANLKDAPTLRSSIGSIHFQKFQVRSTSTESTDLPVVQVIKVMTEVMIHKDEYNLIKCFSNIILDIELGSAVLKATAHSNHGGKVIDFLTVIDGQRLSPDC